MSWPESTTGQRIVRRRLVLGAVVGVVLLSVVASWQFSATPVFSPGALTRHHDRLANNCAACHAIGKTDASAASDAGWDRRKQERNLCKQCHDFEAFAHHAHSVDPDRLAVVTARIQHDATGETGATMPAHSAGGNEAATGGSSYCADCHREHQGTHANLTSLTDRQCQTCHVKEFHRFSDGHSEFSDYPYSRRTRLYFDHMSHYGTHFANFNRTKPNGQVPQSCGACHHLDQLGKQRLAGGFDRMCASCHNQQIDDTTFAGLALFALPALDLTTLRAKQVPIGEWPTLQPPYPVDGTLPPLMQLLLCSEEGFADVEPALGSVDLLVLNDATPEQLRAVENYVWTIKQLLYELAQDGPLEVRQRIANAAGSQVSLSELAELTDIPPTVFAAAQQKWFPNLIAELERRRAGDRVEIPNDISGEPAALPSVTQFKEGWYADDRDCSIRYQPSQHADQLLRTWLEVSARAGIDPASETTGEDAPPASLEVRTVRTIFLSLTRSTSPGRCMKCHTVDATADGSLQINWRGLPVTSGERQFTKFSHLPHVSAAAETCAGCHKFDEQLDFFRAAFLHGNLAANVDPHSVNASGFIPMLKTDCTQCHTRQGVRETCLTCHNYHAGQSPSTNWSALHQNASPRVR